MEGGEQECLLARSRWSPQEDGPSLEISTCKACRFWGLSTWGMSSGYAGEDVPAVSAGCLVSGEDGQDTPFTRLPHGFFAPFACHVAQDLGSPLRSCQDLEPRREGIQSPEVSTRREGIQSPEFLGQLRCGVNHTQRFPTGKARRSARDYRTSILASSTAGQCAERGVAWRACTVRGMEVPAPYFAQAFQLRREEKDTDARSDPRVSECMRVARSIWRCRGDGSPLNCIPFPHLPCALLLLPPA